MRNKKRIAVAMMLLVFLGNINIAFALTPLPPKNTGEEARIETLKKDLETGENYILRAELKMLEYKYNKQDNVNGLNRAIGADFGTTDLRMGVGFGSSFGMGSIPSGLHTDLYGGFSSWGNFDTDGSFDVLTGGRAIDESLQLGSIGRSWNDPDQQLLASVKSSIESYKYEFKKYPSSLKVFATVKKLNDPNNYGYYWTKVWYNGRQQNISDLSDKFNYKILANGTYVLELKDIGKEYELKDITPLAIKSHPWQEMIKGKNVEKSKIFTFVPEDDFLVYFKDVSVATKLEDAAKAIEGPFKEMGRSDEMVGIMEKVTKRLGIVNIKDLEPYLGEVAFVSEDLDFYPKTDYALIVKLDSNFLKDLFSSFKSEKNYQATYEDYLVLSTNERLLKNIEATYKKERASMYDSLDFTYTLGLLDPRRDGLAYFSEKFITKLVGPEHRILAQRRNSIAQALETLQYAVFAYRDIKSEWPKTLKQMADEGYIASEAIKNINDYSIDANGWVSHKDWKSMPDIASIGDVEIGKISRVEKTTYESFIGGYESYWRQFFDPIGVAIVVSDQIMFHTVILPLINESSYNYLTEFFGGDPVELSFVKNPIRTSAMQVAAKLNNLVTYYRIIAEEDSSNGPDAYYGRLQKETDQLLKKYKAEGLSKYNQPFKEGVYDYFQRYPLIQCMIGENFVSELASGGGNMECDGLKKKILSEYPKFDYEKFAEEFKATESKVVKEIANATVKKWLGWETDKDPLSVIGNEVMLGIGETMKFSLENLADVDVYLGLKINDVPLAKEFLFKIFEAISKEIGSRGNYSAGLFSISTTKPMKNTYRDQEYYLVPTGFVNAYYAFLGDSFYLTISQLAMNKLIDGYIDNKGKKAEDLYSSYVQRGMGYVGDKHNIIFSADLEKMQEWKRSFFDESAFKYSEFMGNRLQRDFAYLSEAQTLAKTLPNYDASWKNIDGTYYQYVPKNFPGGTWGIENDKVYLDISGTKYSTENLKNITDGNIKGLFKELDIETAIKNWSVVKNVNIGLKLTPDGLDSRIAFTNPLEVPIDQRFNKASPTPTPVISSAKPSSYQKWFQDIPLSIIAIVGVIILLIIILIIVEIVVHKRKNIPHDTIEPPQDYPPDTTEKL